MRIKTRVIEHRAKTMAADGSVETYVYGRINITSKKLAAYVGREVEVDISAVRVRVEDDEDS